MLKQVVEHINELITSSGMIEKAYGLCDIIEKDGKKFPAEYCLNKYVQVSDFDKYKGLCYHRIDGDVSISQGEDESYGCDVLSSKTYPIILIIGVKKDLFLNDKNDAYVELSIIENLESLISSQNNSTLSGDLSADVVSISLTGASTDKYSIFKREYTGIDFKIPVEYAYISISYDVLITKKLSCHTQITC